MTVAASMMQNEGHRAMSYKWGRDSELHNLLRCKRVVSCPTQAKFNPRYIPCNIQLTVESKNNIIRQELLHLKVPKTEKKKKFGHSLKMF